jgi:primosomal protein N' (replication factor Y)
VARIQTWFIRKIMIKVEPQVSLGKVRTFLLQVQQAVLEEERFRSLQIYYDVDPM